MQDKSAAKRWGALILGLALTWAAVFVVCPAAVRMSPAMTHMANALDDWGIESGAWYYTDVEACALGNVYTRNTIEHLPGRLAAAK